MELVRGIHELVVLGGRPQASAASTGLDRKSCVLTVGNYDGVHLGHRRMIEVLRERAGQYGCPATVLVFEPSAKEFIDPCAAPARLTRWREKVLALSAAGVDRLVTVRFDDQMRAMSPQSFVDGLLVGGLGVRHMVVGHDFRYGSNALGTIDSLLDAGGVHGFSVEQVDPFVIDNVRVSSTAVRDRLASGDFTGAARLLGRRYRMTGRVVYGAALGRTLGFPTANLRVARLKSPLWGVLAVQVFGVVPRGLNGVASLGTRPTVNGIEPLLEVHLFDFAGDLYGRAIEVEFVAKLRDEIKFGSLESMMVQMKEDAAQARAILAQAECG